MITTFARTAAIFAAASLVAVALPAAAASDPSPAAPAAAAPAAKPAKDPTYCVKPVVTGTRINQAMVCKKRSDWIADTGIDPARK